MIVRRLLRPASLIGLALLLTALLAVDGHDMARAGFGVGDITTVDGGPAGDGGPSPGTSLNSADDAAPSGRGNPLMTDVDHIRGVDALPDW